jgi:osmotically-inducible protein OsmY
MLPDVSGIKRDFQCVTARCVERALAAEPELAGARITVIPGGLCLWLSGEVLSEEQGAAAERLARSCTRLGVRPQLTVVGREPVPA